MADKEPRSLRDLIEKQELVVSRAQVLKSGLSRHALAHRLRVGGPWRLLLPGIYLTVSGTATLEQREMAAMLYGGPKAVITGSAALWYRPVTLPESGTIDILIPASSRRRAVSFVNVRRTTRLPGEYTIRGERHFALPARAVADAARDMASLRDVRALVSSAVQKKCCSLDDLFDELDNGPRQGSALLATVFDEVDNGARSAPEAELQPLIKKAGIPMPLFNAKLFLPDGTFIAQPDAWWPRAGVAAEVDSRQWHLQAEHWEKTMDRHSKLGQYGIVTLHFTPYKLRKDPAFAIERMTNAYEAGIARPRLAIKAVPAQRHQRTAS
jgi:hypothetical protein